MAHAHVRRSFKDSLFRMIFREKRELLSLYNAVNGSRYEDPEALEINTIEDALYMGMKNDISFLVEDRLNLYEAQSTWNPNMPLRGLFYFSRLYHGYLEKNRLDLYSGAKLRLPAPRYIVFYNGSGAEEDRKELRLSDSFSAEKGKEYALECVAIVYNINYGHNEEILKNCRKLYEYSYLVEEIRKRLRRGIQLETAVDQAVADCLENRILEDFLRKHRAEVRSVFLSEYDEELHIKSEKERSFQDGKTEGQLIKMIALIRKKLEKGLTCREIAELLEEPEEFVERTAALLQDNMAVTDGEAAALYRKKYL